MWRGKPCEVTTFSGFRSKTLAHTLWSLVKHTKIRSILLSLLTGSTDVIPVASISRRIEKSQVHQVFGLSFIRIGETEQILIGNRAANRRILSSLKGPFCSSSHFLANRKFFERFSLWRVLDTTSTTWSYGLNKRNVELVCTGDSETATIDS